MWSSLQLDKLDKLIPDPTVVPHKQRKRLAKKKASQLALVTDDLGVSLEEDVDNPLLSVAPIGSGPSTSAAPIELEPAVNQSIPLVFSDVSFMLSFLMLK